VRADPAVPTERSDLTVTLKNGRVLTQRIENVIGSVENPLSDAALEAKFQDLLAGVLPKPQAQKLMAMCWDVENAADAGAIARAAAAT
jgi:2-methylcitrate dehydratase PrpD